MPSSTRRSFLAGLAGLGVAVLSGVALLTATPSEAQNGAAPPAAETAKPATVTLRGTLTCLGCELKAAYGAGAQCEVYGHKDALKTQDGKFYTFLETKKAEPLITDKEGHGKPIEVTGTVFPGSQVIEVTDYKFLTDKAGAELQTAPGTKLVVVNTCPMTGEKVAGAGEGVTVVANYEVHFCCASCKPAFDKLSKEEQVKKIEAVVKKG